jgi:hypothetical protein
MVMGNLLSFPDLRNNLHTGKVQCCHPVRTGMPQDYCGKELKVKQSVLYFQNVIQLCVIIYGAPQRHWIFFPMKSATVL